MRGKLVLFFCALGAFAIILASCESGPESNRAVVTVSSINDNAPFFSDVLEQGDSLFEPSPPYNPVTRDDFVREDYVSVTFKNRRYNSFVTIGPSTPLSDFLITRYRVQWRRVDGGVAVPPIFDGATSISVPSNETVEAAVVLVPYEVKNLPFLSDINYLGISFPDEILCIATLTFWGHEVGSDREWSFSAELSVNFADAVVRSE